MPENQEGTCGVYQLGQKKAPEEEKKEEDDELQILDDDVQVLDETVEPESIENKGVYDVANHVES